MSEPKPGESAAEYLKRCMEEATQTLAEAVTYQIDGVDKDPIYVKITPIHFKSRKISINFDTFYGTIITPEDDKKYLYSDCRKNKMNTRLKRSLR